MKANKKKYFKHSFTNNFGSSALLLLNPIRHGLLLSAWARKGVIEKLKLANVM